MGGSWVNKGGVKCGLGLFQHYRNAQTICWPEEDHHRWSDLILREILQNTITVIMGPKDSGKTHTVSKYGLIDYLAFPECTLILISSTDMRGLEMRVWGDLKSLFERARERFDWIPGTVVDSKHAICTDNILEDNVIRDMRKGCLCVPCLSSSGQYVGISKYVGIKQKRRRLLGDEVTFMKESFLDSLANLNSGDFKGVFMGNPIGQDDPLDKLGEPVDGWASMPEPEKTSVWKNRFINGRTINLVGTDSPNFDYPQDKGPRYPYMINQRSIDSVVSFYGKDSLQYHSQCKGTRRSGLNARRVINAELCRECGAMDTAVWKGTNRTVIAGLDAAYGGVGGDRCVGGHIEFGEDVDGNVLLQVYQPSIVPINQKLEMSPETQIANWVKRYCDARDIPPANFFYDATGRGSLGTALARVWSANVEPLEFGGNPSERPVSLDLYVWDTRERKRRLKLCSEHYSKFVTELWFSVRYAIESRQLRGLPEDVMREGGMREWKMTRSDKIEIEAKEDTKERMGRSPDLFDWLVTCVEGARRRGFAIKRIGNTESEANSLEWIQEYRNRNRELRQAHALTFT